MRGIGVIGLGVVMMGAAILARAAQESTMQERCEKEVSELHEFFQDWFNGKLENDEAAFRRFETVMADDFEIIDPEGRSSSRQGIIDRLKGAYGVQTDAAKPMRIWIENAKSRPLADGLHLVTYEEWQETGGITRARLSTAIFSKSMEAPNGVQWHHVHETWLPER